MCGFTAKRFVGKNELKKSLYPKKTKYETLKNAYDLFCAYRRRNIKQESMKHMQMNAIIILFEVLYFKIVNQ